MAVYFLESEEPEPVMKISESSNVSRHIKSIRNSIPQHVELFGVASDGSESLEQALHYEFEEYRIRGDWFKKSEKLMHTARCLCDDKYTNTSKDEVTCRSLLRKYGLDGEKENNGRNSRINFRIDTEKYKELKEVANQSDKSMSGIIRNLIEEYIREGDSGDDKVERIEDMVEEIRENVVVLSCQVESIEGKIDD